jgi:hypothetical protein
MKRVVASIFLLWSAAALAADEVLPAPAVWPCVESVVIAHIERVGELLDYSTEDEIVLHPPSHVDIRISRVLSGIRPPRALTIVHQPELQHGDALFLLGRRNGSWIRLGFEGYLARDRKGRYVVPFFREPEESDLVPRGWIPRDYLEHLREIDYDPKTVAWMGDERNAEPGWARIEGSYAVASRGLVLDDLKDLLAQRLAVPCERNAP